MNERAEDVMPRGYVPAGIDQELSQLQQDVGTVRLASELGILTDGQRKARLRGIARKALKMGTVATVATVALTGASLANVQPASAAEASQSAPIVCQHTASFGRGTWADLGGGNVWVSAPLREYVPRIGWLPSPWAEVDVQKLTRDEGSVQGTRPGTRGSEIHRYRWLTLAKLHTSAVDGTAEGVVHVGGGVDRLRVVHPADSWTRPATGSTRRVVVTTEPLDIV